PESGRAALRVFNASGQLVKTVVGNFEKGYNEVTFRRDEFGTPGVYYYELETPMHSDRKKMILID
ncbi:MAG: T9SS type A sorting domain-containing protein, partial [Saprospiraceae bacterium]|nr:T9SS type A sorting domain-containing protein [Saprospiraceae bacterium]